MERSKQTEEHAAAWLLKRDSGHWSNEDAARLAEWLDTATVNRVAFLRLEAGWEKTSRLKALGAGFARGKVPSIDELSRSIAPASGIAELFPQSRTRGAMWAKLSALAAAVMLAIGTGIFVYTAGPLAGDRYATPIGGVASVPLKDGSSVTLNTASAIRVQLTDKERRIDLARGEAFFDVAKDPARPFVVRAGAKRIVAVGTKFSVRKEGENIRVIVTEGLVRMETADSAGSLLTAGAIARTIDARIAVQNKSVPEAEDTLSWRSGYVVFRETALAEAVAEFNRYNERQIVIQDPAVAAIRLTGKFRSTNYEIFVRLLEDTFQVRAHYTDDQIVLSGR